MKLNTVNVAEYFDDCLQAVWSFSNDKEGNKEAQDLFATLAKENDFSDEEIEIGLDEGYLKKDQNTSDYELFFICTKK